MPSLRWDLFQGHAYVANPSQTDARTASIEVKIRKLDGELARYKEQMSKLRNGPGKVSATSVFLMIGNSYNRWYSGGHPGPGPQNTEAEAHV